jgi:hypothetical protein
MRTRWLPLLVFLLATAGHADSARVLSGGEAVEAWVRLKGDASGAVTYEWVTGTAFAIPEGAPSVPLFRMESVTVRRFERLGRESYLEKNYACRTYRAIADGAFIDRFVNPLTGLEVALSTRCTPAPAIRYTPQSVELLGDLKFDSTALGVPMRLEIIDMDDVTVVRRAVRTQFVSPSSGELRRELSVDSFTLPTRAFRARGRSMLAPAYHWESNGGWMSELGMGQRPGRMAWSIFGRNYRQLSELPADFRAALLARVPDAFDRKF